MWSSSRESAHPTFWGPGEPQDAHGEEDCVAFHQGAWIDTNCEDSHYHSICETL